MLKRRTRFPTSILLSFLGVLLFAAFKAIFDVTIQDLWKETTTPFLREQIASWSAMILDKIGPYWAGFGSALTLIFVIELLMYLIRQKTKLINTIVFHEARLIIALTEDRNNYFRLNCSNIGNVYLYCFDETLPSDEYENRARAQFIINFESSVAGVIPIVKSNKTKVSWKLLKIDEKSAEIILGADISGAIIEFCFVESSNAAGYFSPKIDTWMNVKPIEVLSLQSRRGIAQKAHQ